MSTTRKVLTIIFSILIVAAFAFVLTWGIINWSKVKEGMAGNGLYTQDDVQKSYEDGYNTALSDKSEYEKLIDSYRDTITMQNDLISQHTSEVNILNISIKDCQGQITTLNEQKTALESQVETLNTIRTSNEATITDLNGQIAALNNQILSLSANKDENERQIARLNEQITNLQSLNAQLQETNELNTRTISGLNAQIASLNNQIADLTLQTQNNSSVVNALNVKIAELQKSVSYYEQYLSSLESGEQVVATFEFDGSVYNIQVVNKNSLLTVATPPSTAYVIFNGWTVDGEPIDLATYRITANTKIVADVTHKYEVNFMVEGENHNNQIVLKDAKVTIPANPTKNGYVFDGWTLDGNNVINLTTYTVTQNVTFTAKFTKLYSVVFKYEDSTLKTETVKSGQYATAPSASSTAYKVFNGWKVNGVAANVSEYRITADTVFVADITYKYDVKFMADGTVHNSQIVEKNAKPTAPSNPTKANHTFAGWSVDGVNPIDVSKYTVTENVTFTAIFRIHTYTVTFNNGNTTLSTQTIEHGKYASKPNDPTKTNYVFVGWSIDGTNTVNVSNYAVTGNVTFNAVFRIDKFTVTFQSGTTTISTQQVENGGYATVPTFTSDTFKGWTVDGTTVINVATYKITANTTFIAKHSGGWQLLCDEQLYVYGDSTMNSVDVEVRGLKKGDKIKVTANFMQANITDTGYNSFWYNSPDGNGCYGWQFDGNEWFALDSSGMSFDHYPSEKVLTSSEPFSATLGVVEYGVDNTFTITISCKRDGYLTIEWSDNAGFYIEMMTMWELYVLR